MIHVGRCPECGEWVRDNLPQRVVTLAGLAQAACSAEDACLRRASQQRLRTFIAAGMASFVASAPDAGHAASGLDSSIR